MNDRRPGSLINKYSMRINEEFIETVEYDDLVSSDIVSIASQDYDAILLLTADYEDNDVPEHILFKRA